MLAACCRRVVRAAIKAELPGTARKMSLIVMDLIKSTLETIYDRMKSNVDEAFIKAVTDEMKSYVMTSPSGEQASLETNQSTQESNEIQIVGRFFAKFITGPFVSGRICLQGKDYIYETLGAGATSVVAQLQRILEEDVVVAWGRGGCVLRERIATPVTHTLPGLYTPRVNYSLGLHLRRRPSPGVV